MLAGVGTLESPAPIAFLVAVPAPAAVARGEPTLVLDRIQDPGNVGSVLRSAAAFGFTQAIALVGTAALWSPKVVRAAMGAHFGLRLVEGADEAALDALEVPLFGTSSHAERRLDSVALPWPCAWVFGHEGQGVDAGIAARCAAVLAIPQPGGGESLNVAAAAAVCLYETARAARALNLVPRLEIGDALPDVDPLASHGAGMALTLPSYDDVAAAAARIAGHAHRTPVLTLAHGRRRARRARLLQVRELPAHGRVQVPRRLQRAGALRRARSGAPASSPSRRATTRRRSRSRRRCSACRR